MRGTFDELGTVQLLVDTMAPVIEWQECRPDQSRSAVLVKDNLSEVAGFRAEIDGHWVLFDQKGVCILINSMKIVSRVSTC